MAGDKRTSEVRGCTEGCRRRADLFEGFNGQTRLNAARGKQLCSSLPLILPVGKRLGAEAAADLVDGYEPGDGDRECEACEYGLDTKARKVAPVAMKGVPGFKQKNKEERKSCPGYGNQSG